MINRALAVAGLTAAAVFAAPAAARAANGFMGHYGYMLTYSETYSAKPSFHGALEVADLFPAACKGLGRRMDCAKIGMVELTVLPKSVVVDTMGTKTFDGYIAAIISDAKKAGLKARVRRVKRAGFPAAVIAFPGHPQPLNEMILIQGSKVYYRFKYNDKAGAKEATAIANSLKEIAPHDNPPEPGAR